MTNSPNKELTEETASFLEELSIDTATSIEDITQKVLARLRATISNNDEDSGWKAYAGETIESIEHDILTHTNLKAIGPRTLRGRLAACDTSPILEETIRYHRFLEEAQALMGKSTVSEEEDTEALRSHIEWMALQAAHHNCAKFGDPLEFARARAAAIFKIMRAGVLVLNRFKEFHAK